MRVLTDREPLWFDFGPELIERLAIVSGAGGDFIPEALAAGADGLLTGEAPERSMADAREAGIHLFAAGHYATETFGIRRPRGAPRRALLAEARVHRRAQSAVSGGRAGQAAPEAASEASL